MSVYVLAYVSAAVKPFTEEQLFDLLRQSREKNQWLDITGMLLYKDGAFMQVLEGPREAVLSLMDDIRVDPRHHRIHVILQEHQAARDFEGWSMGFRYLDNDAALDVPGYSDYLDLPLNSVIFKESPTISHGLLRCFRQLGESTSA